MSPLGRKIRWSDKTLLMAILNVTPDSFSNDGCLNVDDCVAKALAFVEQGADIIDIGGESTRPGYTAVDLDTELARVLPVVAALRQRSDVLISVDTRKPEVFSKARRSGADIFNSVAGFSVELATVAAEEQCPFVIMHCADSTKYESGVVDCVLRYFEDSAGQAIKSGCREESIILDPGIGFGKLPEQNIELLRSLQRIKALGFPVLVGASRKSTLGVITGRPVEQRVFATAAAVALSIAAGVDIVRVHDVEAMLDVVKLSDAIIRAVPENR